MERESQNLMSRFEQSSADQSGAEVPSTQTDADHLHEHEELIEHHLDGVNGDNLVKLMESLRLDGSCKNNSAIILAPCKHQIQNLKTFYCSMAGARRNYAWT